MNESTHDYTQGAGGFLIFASGWLADITVVQIIGLAIGLSGVVLGILRYRLEEKKHRLEEEKVRRGLK